MGDYEQAAPWSEDSVKGCKRFVDRTWNLLEIVNDGNEYSAELSSAMHKTIKKVSEDIEQMKFNTAVAALMTLLNQIYAKGSINHAELKTYLLLLNPFAPHVTEEMWEKMGFGGTVTDQSWPEYDEAKCVDATVEIAVQVNGKIKTRIDVATEISSEDAIAAAKEQPEVAAAMEGKTVVKELYVKGKLVNIVVK
jgi:leucyl-tRNA synthetase